MPALLARAGLHDIGFAARPGCMGYGPRDRWRPLLDGAAHRMIDGAAHRMIDGAAHRMIDSGAVGRGDMEAFHADLADPGFVDIPQITLAVWGRLPTA